MSARHSGLARWVALFVLVASLGACSWFTDFKEQPKFDPWDSADSVPARGNPQNSVSIYGTAVPGYAISRLALPGVLDSMSSLPNPVPADARSLHNGRMYYQINCAVCHGEGGKGDGPVANKGIYPPPLVGASAEGRSDGYIWAIMRNGRGAMPAYNRIEESDRWDVVNYVRGLQGRFTVVAGPVGLPGETGNKVPGPSQMGASRSSAYFMLGGTAASRQRAATDSAVVAPAAAPAGADSAVRMVPPAQPTISTTPRTGGDR